MREEIKICNALHFKAKFKNGDIIKTTKKYISHPYDAGIAPIIVSDQDYRKESDKLNKFND